MRRALDAAGRWPRWVKLAILAAVLVGFGLGIRHYRNVMQAPPPVIDRGPLLRAAEAQLRSDPAVADIVYVPAADQWNATPRTLTGPPEDFARYICFVLSGADATGPHTSVRVIDAAQLATNGMDYSAAATATVLCAQEENR